MSAQPTAGRDKPSMPESPELAVFLVGVMQGLGCSFTIDSTGRRAIGWPDSPSLDCSDGIPQMFGAAPSQQFHCDDEWRGAVKLAHYWLQRLSARDKELAFTLAASVCADPRQHFDFREQLQ